MNWGGFAVGFRFAAKEVTEGFKKECWKTVIQAASYADLKDMFLHEAQLADPLTGMQTYIPIIGSPTLGPIQKNSQMWHRDAALLGHLTFYRPFVQENYLELFAPSHSVGTFLPDGRIQLDEGISFLPEKIEKCNFVSKKRKALFLSRIESHENTEHSYADAMKKVAEHAPTFEISRLNYTEDHTVLYYAAAFRNALLYAFSFKTGTGEKKDLMYALLPGGMCIADIRQISDPEEFKTFLKTIINWHGQGAEVLCRYDQAPELPERCFSVTDALPFYRLKKSLPEQDALFCEKTNADFFKEHVNKTLIEI